MGRSISTEKNIEIINCHQNFFTVFQHNLHPVYCIFPSSVKCFMPSMTKTHLAVKPVLLTRMTFSFLLSICQQSESLKYWNTQKSVRWSRFIKYSRWCNCLSLHSRMVAIAWRICVAVHCHDEVAHLDATLPGIFLWQLQKVSWLSEHNRHLSPSFPSPSS